MIDDLLCMCEIQGSVHNISISFLQGWEEKITLVRLTVYKSMGPDDRHSRILGDVIAKIFSIIFEKLCLSDLHLTGSSILTGKTENITSILIVMLPFHLGIFYDSVILSELCKWNPSTYKCFKTKIIFFTKFLIFF